MNWSETPMVAFDTETTGPDPDTARIVTACIALVNTVPAEPPRTWLADPGVEIPAEATAVHGITTEHAREHGQHPAGVLAAVREQLIDAWEMGRPVVAYNASYDMTVLDRELRRYDLPGLDVHGLVVDPLVLDRHVDRYRRGSRKLTAACAHYRVALDGAHDAAEDALAAARVAWRIFRQHPELDAMDADDLHALQVTAHWKWATEFEQYLTRKGTPERIDPSWPIRGAATTTGGVR